MNLESPCCRRCEGTRFFRVQRMRDAAVGFDHARLAMRWEDRPVRVIEPLDHAAAQRTIGHFETLVCRGCGLTEWYARDWEPESLVAKPAPCPECASTTAHARLPAVEHTGGKLDQARITQGMLGREGYLQTEICTACDRVEWRGVDYHHLDRKHFVHYRLASESARACLRCGGHDAILDDHAQEADGFSIPIAMREPGFFARYFGASLGAFQLRLCRPCGSVEWYGQKLNELSASEDGAVLLVGETPQMTTVGGPYR